jgi:hypothetical protein
MAIVRPLIISKIQGFQCYYIPGLDPFFNGVKNIELDFGEDDLGRYLKIRPFRDPNVSRYVLSECL